MKLLNNWLEDLENKSENSLKETQSQEKISLSVFLRQLARKFRESQKIRDKEKKKR